MISKKGWFSNREILHIYQQLNWGEDQKDPSTRNETLNTEKQGHSTRIETQNNENRNTTDPNTT